MTQYTVRITVRGKKYIFTASSKKQVADTVNGTPMVSAVEVVAQTYVGGELAEQRELTERETLVLLGIEEATSEELTLA